MQSTAGDRRPLLTALATSAIPARWRCIHQTDRRRCPYIALADGRHAVTQFLPRDSYAKRGICRRRVSVCVCVCVCLCVCVSVTLRYCIKTAKHRITQTTPHDSPMTLVFLTPKIMAKFVRDHPLRGRQMQVGWVKTVSYTHLTLPTILRV